MMLSFFRAFVMTCLFGFNFFFGVFVVIFFLGGGGGFFFFGFFFVFFFCFYFFFGFFFFFFFWGGGVFFCLWLLFDFSEPNYPKVDLTSYFSNLLSPRLLRNIRLTVSLSIDLCES